MAARIDDLLVLGQNISKTDLAKYLRDREAVLPFDFGGLGDGAANDRAAIQACFQVVWTLIYLNHSMVAASVTTAR